MAQPATRDRRAGFGTPSIAATDPESLERENDRGIDALGDRVSELRRLTYATKSEVDSQNSVLENMGDMVTRAQFGLGASVTRFKRVFEDPKRRNTFVIVIVAVILLFILYLVLTRKRS